MQQLQPIGDSSVTPTKIRFTGGEAVFSKEDLLEARDLENKLSRVLKLAVFALGKILRAVHQRKYYGSSGKWGGGDVVGTFRIPNLLPVRLSI